MATQHACVSAPHALCDVRHTVRARARALLRYTRKLCALPLFSSCSFSLHVFSLFSSFNLLLSCLESSLSSSSLVFLSRLSSPPPPLIFLSRLSFCLFLLSLSLPVMLCVVVVVVLFGGRGVCLVCVFVFVCCGTVKKRGKIVCGFTKVTVCTFKTSPCMPEPRAYVLKHVRVVPVHTGTF